MLAPCLQLDVKTDHLNLPLWLEILCVSFHVFGWRQKPGEEVVEEVSVPLRDITERECVLLSKSIWNVEWKKGEFS